MMIGPSRQERSTKRQKKSVVSLVAFAYNQATKAGQNKVFSMLGSVASEALGEVGDVCGYPYAESCGNEDLACITSMPLQIPKSPA
jgi:hypothetical protein